MAYPYQLQSSCSTRVRVDAWCRAQHAIAGRWGEALPAFQLPMRRVESPDIRAGMAMLLAALAAQGDSVIHNIGQIERGYERIDERLQALGAQIERIDGQADERVGG